MAEDTKQSQGFDSDSSEEPSAQSLPDLTRRLAHSLQKPFNCQTCSKKFASKKSLADHMRAHSGEKPYQCEVCAKLFLRSGDLKRHLMMHSGEKPFQCEICQKQFPRKGNLQLHRITHTKSRPHQCEQCGRFFAQKSGLTQHMLVHTGIKRFQCELCLKEFARKAYLQKHMLSHRAVPLDCEVCGKTFSASRNLKLHALSHKLYHCYICEEVFKEKGAYHRHMASHDESVECQVCFKQFTSTYLLNKHSKIHAAETESTAEEISIDSESMELEDVSDLNGGHCDMKTETEVFEDSCDVEEELWTEENGSDTVHVKTENVETVCTNTEETQKNVSSVDRKRSNVHTLVLRMVPQLDGKSTNVHTVQTENIMKEMSVNVQNIDFEKVVQTDVKLYNVIALENENSVREGSVNNHNGEFEKVSHDKHADVRVEGKSVEDVFVNGEIIVFEEVVPADNSNELAT